MNRDDIIRMAREAGFVDSSFCRWSAYSDDLERFFHKAYAAGAAAERESMTKDGWRRCAVNQRTTQFCGMLEDAVKAEREACAKVCEAQENKIVKSHPARVEFDPNSYMAKFCAAAIRARGEK